MTFRRRPRRPGRRLLPLPPPPDSRPAAHAGRAAVAREGLRWTKTGSPFRAGPARARSEAPHRWQPRPLQRRAARVEAALTMEPMYQGEPILAVAAVDEATAIAAIERITVEYEPLPFVVDPLDSLRPGGPNARRDGNVLQGTRIVDVKWTDADFADVAQGRMPMGRVLDSDQWSFGDLEAGFKEAAIVVEESFVIPSTSHMPLEPRSAMAYWQNGKLYLHCSSQGLAQTVPVVARYFGLTQSQVVLISPYTGGGIRQQERVVIHPLRDSGAAREEDGTAGDDADHPRRRAAHRPRASGDGRPCEGRVRERRPHHGHRLFLISDAGPYGRGDHVSARASRLGALPADGHALPRHRGADQHADAGIAARDRACSSRR